MLHLRINPVVVADLKSIRDFIADDSEEYASKTINSIYERFQYIQMFPNLGSELSNRVSFKTYYKYVIWKDYIIIYKFNDEFVEIYRVINRYQDMTSIFDE